MGVEPKSFDTAHFQDAIGGPDLSPAHYALHRLQVQIREEILPNSGTNSQQKNNNNRNDKLLVMRIAVHASFLTSIWHPCWVLSYCWESQTWQPRERKQVTLYHKEEVVVLGCSPRGRRKKIPSSDISCSLREHFPGSSSLQQPSRITHPSLYQERWSAEAKIMDAIGPHT